MCFLNAFWSKAVLAVFDEILDLNMLLIDFPWAFTAASENATNPAKVTSAQVCTCQGKVLCDRMSVKLL